MGFRSFIREVDRGFSVLDTLVYLETRQLTYEATLELLHRHLNCVESMWQVVGWKVRLRPFARSMTARFSTACLLLRRVD